MTKKMMSENGIEFEEVDMSQNPAAAQQARDLGYQSAPIVITPDEHWSGFRVDKIRALAGALVPA